MRLAATVPQALQYRDVSVRSTTTREPYHGALHSNMMRIMPGDPLLKRSSLIDFEIARRGIAHTQLAWVVASDGMDGRRLRSTCRRASADAGLFVCGSPAPQ